MRKTSTNSAVMMQANSGSPALEAYRSLRFNIECFDLERGVQTIAITSAGRGEGKTTTALNLAIVYAQYGKKVILLDANLRYPSLHHVFGLDNSRGLVNLLIHQSTANEITRESGIENLSIILSGPIPSNPSELLASKQMGSLLTELNQNYDVVIVDTPPVLTLTDAKIIASKCDGVLLVVEHGKVKRSEAEKVKEELMLAKAKLVGVVMNKIKEGVSS